MIIEEKILYITLIFVGVIFIFIGIFSFSEQYFKEGIKIEKEKFLKIEDSLFNDKLNLNKKQIQFNNKIISENNRLIEEWGKLMKLQEEQLNNK